jgi:hypothetical protein
MLKTLSVTLVTTALIAGTAFAAQPDNAATPATAPAAANSQTTPANGQTAAKPANPTASTATVKSTGKQVRHHTAHVAKPAVTNVKSPT